MLTRRQMITTTTTFAGYAVAVDKVLAQAIKTDTDGIVAGDQVVKIGSYEMPVYEARPASGKDTPIVLVISEIWGVHEYIRDCTRRFAKAGSYVNVNALKNISFEARHGDRIALVGNNGSGKSTLLRVLSEVYPPTRGSVEIIGMSPACNVEQDHGLDDAVCFIPDETDMLARLRYGADSPENRAKASRGSGMMVSFTRGRGEVFNAGTCEWVAGLKARDPGIVAVTRNVLARFTS